MRAGTAGKGEAEPTAPAAQAKMCGVLVAVIQARGQTDPGAKDDDVLSVIKSVTNP